MSRRRVIDQAEAAAPCRHCGCDLLPITEVGRRLGVGEKALKRWHRLHGLPLIQLPGVGCFALWSVIEQWALERMAARSPEHVELEPIEAERGGAPRGTGEIVHDQVAGHVRALALKNPFTLERVARHVPEGATEGSGR